MLISLKLIIFILIFYNNFLKNMMYAISMAAGQRLIVSVYNNCEIDSFSPFISDIVSNLGQNFEKI
jgi:hypothetical protein